MIEVPSGSIASGVRYTVGNITTPPGTGTITYNSVVYAIGASFLGQPGITTYTATLTAKVYQDDTELQIFSESTAIIDDEIAPYPEQLQFLSDLTAENFNENEEVVYPEHLQIFSFMTSYGTPQNNSQIIITQ